MLYQTTALQCHFSEQTGERVKPKEHQTALIAILVIYFVLAFYRIGHQSFWVDEIRSLESASIAGSFLSSSIWQRGQGPFYFALLHLWGQFSSSESVLRSLSVIFGSISVCLIYLLGMALFNRRVGQIAAIILVTSPFMIWYSQEVRYITLGLATSLLAIVMFRQALRMKRFGWWLLYSGMLILAVGTLVTNVFLILAHGLYVLHLNSRRSTKPWLIAQLVVFIVFVWWANGAHLWSLGGYWKRTYVELTVQDKSNYQETDRLVSGGHREFSVGSLPYTFFAFSTGFSLGPSLSDLHTSRSVPDLLAYAPIITACAILFFVATLLGVVSVWRDPDKRMFLGLWLFVPILAVLGISAMTGMAYNVRYVIASLPAYVLLLAAGIDTCTRRPVRIGLILSVLCVSGFSLRNYYFNPRYGRDDGRGVAHYLELAAHSKDIIVGVGDTTSLTYYYRGDLPIVNFNGGIRNDPTLVTTRLQQLIKQYDRLWLVEIRAWETDPKRQTRSTLDMLSGPGLYKEFGGVDVYTYQVRK
jgi:uncharacterized membrane protein